MYWPIGAPRIYAAGNSGAQTGPAVQFNDDVKSHKATDETNSPVDGPNSSQDAVQDNDDSKSGVVTPSTPLTPGIKPVEYDAQRRLSARALGSIGNKLENLAVNAEAEHILALCMSRSGHLFAVITTTSLTIWQTKVKNLIPPRDAIVYSW